MSRPKGLPKTGGRQTGTPNKRTVVERAKLAESGLLPLDYLLTVMRDDEAEQPIRLDAAKAAAPYVHARLQSIEIDAGLLPEINVKVDVLVLARQIAVSLMLGDQRLLGSG